MNISYSWKEDIRDEKSMSSKSHNIFPGWRASHFLSRGSSAFTVVGGTLVLTQEWPLTSNASHTLGVASTPRMNGSWQPWRFSYRDPRCFKHVISWWSRWHPERKPHPTFTNLVGGCWWTFSGTPIWNIFFGQVGSHPHLTSRVELHHHVFSHKLTQFTVKPSPRNPTSLSRLTMLEVIHPNCKVIAFAQFCMLLKPCPSQAKHGTVQYISLASPFPSSPGLQLPKNTPPSLNEYAYEI